MSATYKRLEADDLALFRQLNAVFGRAFGELWTYNSAPPGDAYLKSLLGRRHVVPLVALEDGLVLGGLVAYVLEKFEQERREIYIYDLAVDEPHRRRGIARGLIRLLQEIARVEDAYVIFVQADYGDLPAITLYESLGTREEVLHFDLEVQAPPPPDCDR
jgi:aminoglycoside 3-N-acetyltransferase I